MRRGWVAAGVVIVAAASGVGCRDLLGLQEPIVEADDGGAEGASTTYPAFQPGPPQLEGDVAGVISQPQVRVVFFPDDPLAGPLATGGVEWITSSTWSTQTLEYEVLRGGAAGIVTLTETAPASLTDADVQTWLAGKLDGSQAGFGPVDAATLASELFIIVYPQGTTITASGRTSCQEPSGFTGYHSELALGTARVTYIVLPRCDGSIADLTTAASYEMLATVTNPRPVALPNYASFDQDHLAWNFLSGDGGTELPQPCCVPSASGCTRLSAPFGDAGAAVARSWSNERMQEYHDPCVPTDSTPYFASVPVMNDDISFPGTYPTKGIQVPIGQSRMVDVQLWSDAPTSGPWTIAAMVLPGHPQDALGLALDRATGTNGDTRHLTVTANQAGPIPFALVSTLGSKQTTWVGLVGQ